MTTVPETAAVVPAIEHALSSRPERIHRRTYSHLQRCRIVAAVLVVCFHAGGNVAKDAYFGASAAPIEQLFSFGGLAGVAFFFVLSGFIITHVHHDDVGRPRRLGAYLTRRILRIYPTYVVVFAAVLSVSWLVPAWHAKVPHDAATLLEALLLLPLDKNVVGGTGAPVLVVAWSLQYEMVFYVVVALLIVSRGLFALAVGAMLAAFAVSAVAPSVPFPVSFFGHELVLLFWMGMIASQASRSRVAVANPRPLAWLAGSAFAAVAVVDVWSSADAAVTAKTLAYGAAAAVLVFALVRLEDSRPPSPPDTLTDLLGESSYALYLIHFPIIAALSKAAVTIGLHGFVGAVCAVLMMVATAVGAAIAFHVVIERPLLRWLNTFRRPRLMSPRGG